MPANTTPIFPVSLRTDQVTFVNADGTGFKTLITPGADGVRVDSISITSDDTSARVLQFAVQVGGTDYVIGEVNVPIGAGTDGTTVAVSGLNQVNMPMLVGMDGSLYLPSGTLLRVRSKVAVTAARFIYVVAFGGNYS